MYTNNNRSSEVVVLDGDYDELVDKEVRLMTTDYHPEGNGLTLVCKSWKKNLGRLVVFLSEGETASFVKRA